MEQRRVDKPQISILQGERAGQGGPQPRGGPPRSAPGTRPESPRKEPAWDRLSLEDLAGIFDLHRRTQVEIVTRLAWIVRQEPALTTKVAMLDQMARDAGMASFEIVWLVHQRFDHLVELEHWDDPGEVFGLDDPEDVFYPALIRIAAARAARDEEARERHLEIKERLLAAEVRNQEQRMQDLLEWLIGLSPEGAGRVLDRLREMVENGAGASSAEPAGEG